MGLLTCVYVDVATTTLEEQRKTDWLENESLIDFLDPNDHSKTIEGYQAPKRAVILANKIKKGKLFPFLFSIKNLSYLQ